MSDHEPIPRRLELRMATAAARILATDVGVRLAAVVLADVGIAQARKEPFRHLPAPEDERETLCRRQAGPAILIQKALTRWLGSERALEITRKIVIEGTLLFLSHTVGPLNRDELMALSDEAREARVRAMGERFFNAEMQWDEISERAVRFTVKSCRFPALCEAGGAPEVAPLLCQGDAVYFSDVLGTVDLTRVETLADGGSCCPFVLTWREAGEDASASS